MSLHDLQQGKCQNHLTLLRERERERVQIVQERLKQQEGQQRSCGRFWAYHGPQSPGSTEQEIFTLFSTTIKHGIDAVSMSQQAYKQLTLFLARTLKKNDMENIVFNWFAFEAFSAGKVMDCHATFHYTNELESFTWKITSFFHHRALNCVSRQGNPSEEPNT